jgi:hypothetical protein
MQAPQNLAFLSFVLLTPPALFADLADLIFNDLPGLHVIYYSIFLSLPARTLIHCSSLVCSHLQQFSRRLWKSFFKSHYKFRWYPRCKSLFQQPAIHVHICMLVPRAAAVFITPGDWRVSEMNAMGEWTSGCTDRCNKMSKIKLPTMLHIYDDIKFLSHEWDLFRIHILCCTEISSCFLTSKSNFSSRNNFPFHSSYLPHAACCCCCVMNSNISLIRYHDCSWEREETEECEDVKSNMDGEEKIIDCRCKAAGRRRKWKIGISGNRGEMINCRRNALKEFSSAHIFARSRFQEILATTYILLAPLLHIILSHVQRL